MRQGVDGVNSVSARVDELARQLARLTGEDLETAVQRAIEERLSRLAPAAQGGREAALRTFFERVSAMPDRDGRSSDEIIGYGPDGLPE